MDASLMACSNRFSLGTPGTHSSKTDAASSHLYVRFLVASTQPDKRAASLFPLSLVYWSPVLTSFSPCSQNQPPRQIINIDASRLPCLGTSLVFWVVVEYSISTPSPDLQNSGITKLIVVTKKW